ncbi:MAG: hypothetical protein DRN21_03890 [Thermoplasmata archaeon]|nr:MAG: hypothetical protein DRN21_03890 [Thermoplasmata archaeon]
MENTYRIIHLHYSNLGVNSNCKFFEEIKKGCKNDCKEIGLQNIFSFDDEDIRDNYFDRFAYHRIFKKKFKALKLEDPSTEGISTVFFENGVVLIVSTYVVTGDISEVIEKERECYDKSEEHALKKFKEIEKMLPSLEKRYNGIDHHRIVILLPEEERTSLNFVDVVRLITGKHESEKIRESYIEKMKNISREKGEYLVFHWRADFIKHQKSLSEQLVNLIIFSRLLKYELKVLDNELGILITKSIEKIDELKETRPIYWSPVGFKRLMWNMSEKKIYLIERLEYLDNYSKAFQSNYFITAMDEMEEIYRIRDWRKSIEKKIQYLDEFLTFFDGIVTEFTDKFAKIIGLLLTLLASIISFLLAIQVGGAIAVISLIVALAIFLAFFVIRERTVFSWKIPRDKK